MGVPPLKVSVPYFGPCINRKDISMSNLEYSTECLVIGKKNKIAIIKTVVGLVCAVAGMMLAFSRESMLIGVIGAAGGAFAYISYSTIFREYEYTIGESTLSVDVIYSKKRRKPLVVWDIDTICLFAPEGSEELAYWQRQRNAFHDFSSASPDEAHFYSVCQKGGRVTVSKLTPSAPFLAALKQSLPRSVFQVPRQSKKL